MKRTLAFFLLSLLATLVILCGTSEFRKRRLHRKMVAYALASSRESDGAENLFILDGKAGYLGESGVYLEYKKDGYIHLFGDNKKSNNCWKKISEFEIEPGTYTLTGMSGVPENTIVLQFRISDDNGWHETIFQWDEDVQVTVDRELTATLHIMVYPNVNGIDTVARPGLYKDE